MKVSAASHWLGCASETRELPENEPERNPDFGGNPRNLSSEFWLSS
jgi:hypothetical protein